MTTGITGPAFTGVEPVLEGRYQWFKTANEAEFREYLTGYQIAEQAGLPKQLSLYKEQLRDIAGRDLAEHTQARVRAAWPQSATKHAAKYPIPSSFSETVRKEQITRSDGWRTVTITKRTYWQYTELAEFGQLIPPHAMQAVALVSSQPISPEGYWVASLREKTTIIATLCPILWGAFGRWMVSIAKWD